MKRWLIVSVALTVAALAGGLYVYFGLYDRLPEQVPVHWGIDGQPDGWVARENAIWIFLITPGVMLLFLGLTFLLPAISPARFGVEDFRDTWNYLMTLVLALFAYIQAAVLWASLSGPPHGIRPLVAGLFVFFALFGNVLGKVRRNFWLGIRTPWTLASEAVWNRTHRVWAWGWTAMGVIGIVATLLGAPYPALFVFLIVGALGPVPHSYFIYRRLHPAGSAPE
jgi:uncharacterized membrane protein